jgi:hypothetical protein
MSLTKPEDQKPLQIPNNPGLKLLGMAVTPEMIIAILAFLTQLMILCQEKIIPWLSKMLEKPEPEKP